MIYWEDLEVGVVRELGPRKLTAEEIIAFAREYDPQPFHIDEEAAKRSVFGGLIASGWQTASICMRMVVDGFLKGSASLGSPGLDELRWLKPVRPGDSLTLRVEIVERTPSRSKPDRGSIKVRYEMRNQHGDVVMTMLGLGLVGRRPVNSPPGG